MAHMGVGELPDVHYRVCLCGYVLFLAHNKNLLILLIQLHIVQYQWPDPDALNFHESCDLTILGEVTSSSTASISLFLSGAHTVTTTLLLHLNAQMPFGNLHPWPKITHQRRTWVAQVPIWLAQFRWPHSDPTDHHRCPSPAQCS